MQTQEILRLFIPIAGLAVNVIVQVAGFRLFPGMGLLKSVFVGFGAGILGVWCFELYVLSHFPARAVAEAVGFLATNTVIAGLLGYCYFHFVNLGETARRIRIVRELYDAPQEGLLLSEILERYNSRDMVAMRLSRLLNNGQLVEREGRLFIGNPAMLRMSQAMTLCKRLILGENRKFD
jgi:hypothetical protein